MSKGKCPGGEINAILSLCTYQVIIVSYFVNIWTFGGNNNIQIFSYEHRFIVSSPVNIKVTLAER